MQSPTVRSGSTIRTMTISRSVRLIRWLYHRSAIPVKYWISGKGLDQFEYSSGGTRGLRFTATENAPVQWDILWLCRDIQIMCLGSACSIHIGTLVELKCGREDSRLSTSKCVFKGNARHTLLDGESDMKEKRIEEAQPWRWLVSSVPRAATIRRTAGHCAQSERNFLQSMSALQVIRGDTWSYIDHEE